MRNPCSPVRYLFLVTVLALIPSLAHAGGKPPAMVVKSYPVADLVNPETTVSKNPLDPAAIYQCKTSLNFVKSGDTKERELMNVIKNTVAPMTWQGNGGSGEMVYCPLSLCLIVRQLPAVQTKVDELLKSLRCLQDAQETLQIEKKANSPTYLGDFALIRRLFVSSEPATPMPVMPMPATLCTEATCPAGGDCCAVSACCMASRTTATPCMNNGQCCSVKAVQKVQTPNAIGQQELQEVAKLAQADKSDAFIIDHIRNSGGLFNLTTEQIGYLKQYHVSDTVINYMQTMGPVQPAYGPITTVSVPGCCEVSCPVCTTVAGPRMSGMVCTGVASSAPVAKPKSRKDHVLEELVRAYEEACSEGKTKEAAKFAKAALSLDPTCFTSKR